MKPATLAPPTRLLLVGPLPIAEDVIGGTKVLFAELVAGFERSPRFETTVVNTSRPLRGKRAALRRLLDAAAFVRVLARLWRECPRQDVVLFNVSSRGLIASGPFVWALCRLRRTPLVVRLFGGDFAQRFDAASGLRRTLLRRTVLRCDKLLVETDGLRERFRDADRVERYPNTRDLPETPRVPREEGRGLRFLFLGQIWHEKGFLHALEASDRLETAATVEFYGPLMPGACEAIFDAHPRANWHGSVEPEAVPGLLARHDVLLFPTRYTTEGMPGVVLEAMQAGLPVIASRWPAAHEMIEDGVDGLLVEVGSTESLAQAMRVLERSEELREKLALRARDTGDRYRHAAWQARLERWLDELVGRAPELRSTRTEHREVA
ncbi:MAG: glycosyltransferase family 4 protein [Planctomycetes bacterium]|nr:glycosyltransferase family 4 protein [Planctomycetota bacterium]MCB9903606.1 glycosyltransferase family 4 protein [Planctomycetota bacterium]